MKKIYLTTTLLVYSISMFAQYGNDDYEHEDDNNDFERYAHLGLSKEEIISIIIGIILLLIAKYMSEKYSILRMITGFAGFLCILPIIMVILAVTQKVITYAVILAIIVGIIYFLFRSKK
jgi:hypothetical protein